MTIAAALLAVASGAVADELPPGYWPPERTPEVLQMTRTVKLAPSLADLTSGERRAVAELIEAGKIVQRMYEDALHPQAVEAIAELEDLVAKSGPSTQSAALFDLYRLFHGPIATTPDNRREAFMPVRPETPARNVYPQLTREQFDAYLAKNPEQRDELLNSRTVVRQATAENLKHDLAVLNRFPVVDALHPGLRRQLEALQADPDGATYYAIPYSVRWANELQRIFTRLNNAARHVENSDPEFARYLRNRSRDLLSDDYESGDAAWVSSTFKRLNAQIGAYETYDDALYGAKAFMSLSILKRDEAASRAARDSIRQMQHIENALPSPQHRRISENLAVGVYDVIADFGQARGGNRATILPNDPLMVKRYGRVLLLRDNILSNPELLADEQLAWKALVASPFDGDLTEEGEFNRVLWHEVGHYLGVDHDKRGRSLGAALESSHDVFEELKADLASLFAATWLRKNGDIGEHDAVLWYASGMNRALQETKPRRDQPYRVMRLMQFNWLHEHGVFELEPSTATVMMHYDRFPEAVAEMLEQVLKLQHDGDRAAAEAFIERWTAWQPELHDAVGQILRDNRGARYVLFRYGAMGE